MEERHAFLQQFEEHDVVKIITRVHRDFHVSKKAAKQCSIDARDDAEHVYILYMASIV